MNKEVIFSICILIFVIGCNQPISYEEAEAAKEQGKEVCPEGTHEYGTGEGITCVECTEAEHCQEKYGSKYFCGDDSQGLAFFIEHHWAEYKDWSMMKNQWNKDKA